MVSLTTPTPTNHNFTYNSTNKKSNYTSPLQKTIQYSYDRQKRVTKITLTSNNTIDIEYTNSQLTKLTTPQSTINYKYNNSHLSTITKDDQSTNYTYDGNLLTKLEYSGTLNQSINYTYNDDMLIDSITYDNQTQHYYVPFCQYQSTKPLYST